MAHDVNQCEMDIAAQVRSALISRISSERFDLWMSSKTNWQWHQGVLSVEFESDFKCQFVKRNWGADLLAVTQAIAGPNTSVQLSVVQQDNDEFNTKMPVDPNQPTRVVTNEPAELQGTDQGVLVDGFVQPLQVVWADQSPPKQDAYVPSIKDVTPKSTAVDSSPWSRFIPGACNQLAWTTAQMIVAEPGRMTPVLLHGPCGVGKSHLLGAIAQHLRTHCRMRRVVFMTSEQFTNDFTESIKGGGLPMFRRKYRDVEALIIDDIQFFAGKKATIGELKHTLDNLLRTGKQVVFTADRSVNDLNSLGSDVVGRLRGGLVTPLMPIDVATRTSLLQRVIDEANIELPKEVVRQITTKAVGDGRVLMGIAKRLMAVASLAGGSLSSSEQCWNAVYDLVQATQPIIRLGDIERVVCEVFNLPPNSLQSSSKIRTIAQPRMLAMFLARKYTPAAYKEIGEYFGHRRHSTVISAERTVEEWLRDNANLGDVRGLTVKEALRHVESSLQVG
jgi:chromosomal replication initiator protein